ncbi:hypothetical protein [Nesterenkonia sp. NBAIMH1]|uniref:hypothetical protein n=1 Tax=Nesterenkonia sp. NBAIMH1 TaxID=2600320 RepID=UPI0011B7663A|nr:hypothetical protein [Nesterenkonia sp. NBAIMH1]
MRTRNALITPGLMALVPVLLLATSCGEDSAATTFDGVEDLISSMEDEGLECGVMDGTTLGDGANEAGEQVMCVEGHTLMVWDEDADLDTESSDDDPLVQGMEEQGTIEHLRGENWHIMSIDDEVLDELEDSFGGVRDEEGFPNFAVD